MENLMKLKKAILGVPGMERCSVCHNYFIPTSDLDLFCSEQCERVWERQCMADDFRWAIQGEG